MSKSKDKVINEMRKIAIRKPKHTDLISLLSLAASLYHLQTHENPNLCHDFIQIICRSANFNLSYEQLAGVCHYNEKSLRLHCRHYAKIFLRECGRIRQLSLPLLVARLIEYKSSALLNTNIPALRVLEHSRITAMIGTYPCSNEEKQVALILCNHFYGNASQAAI